MRRLAFSVAILLLAVAGAGVSTPSGVPISPTVVETLPAGRDFYTITRLGSGAYAIGGIRSTGGESWEGEPTIAFTGSSDEENIYYVDGLDISDIGHGTVSSFEFLEEVSVETGGFTAEYGSTSTLIQDYQRGGGGVINMITKSGGNEFRGESFMDFNESLSDLASDEEGTLWAAGMTFGAEGPTPLIGFFDENGMFTPIDDPFDFGLGQVKKKEKKPQRPQRLARGGGMQFEPEQIGGSSGRGMDFEPEPIVSSKVGGMKFEAETIVLSRKQRLKRRRARWRRRRRRRRMRRRRRARRRRRRRRCVRRNARGRCIKRLSLRSR